MTVQFNTKTLSRGIEWCTRTENPVGGCKHGCRWQMPDGTTAVCYAEQLANFGVAKAGYPDGFEAHYWRGEQGLRNLVSGKRADLIFCDSMSDLFGHWVPAGQVTAVLNAMRQAPHHAYQSLTKAPGNLRKFIGNLPRNLWVGVSSAPDQMMGHEMSDRQKEAYTLRALDVLREVRQTAGNLTWMSLEPVSWDMAHLFREHPLDWVVIGAAMNNGRYYQPDPQHVTDLLNIFDASGTPVFFKGNIKATIKDLGFEWREDFPVAYRDGTEIPAVLRRQEMAKLNGWPLNSLLLAREYADAPTAQMSFFV